MQLFNDTPFVAQCFEQANMSGSLNAVVVARGSFILSLEEQGQFRRVDDRRDANWHDVFETTDRGTSLVNPGDMAPFKPRTDLTISGTAISPEPQASWEVAVEVGAYRKSLRVHGERYWEPISKGFGRKTFAGWRMTEAKPSTSVALTWENAFGGKRPTEDGRDAAYEDNPVGVGTLDEALTPKDRLIPAPRIEAAECPIVDWRAGYKPECFAPVAPWWGTRRRHAGTFDDSWRETRAPLPPRDFKYDFWQAAPDDQSFFPWLFGNEELRLSGLSSSGALKFVLPLQKIFLLVRYKSQDVTSNIMFLDGINILVDNNAARLRLTWRASFPLTPGIMYSTIAMFRTRNAI